MGYSETVGVNRENFEGLKIHPTSLQMAQIQTLNSVPVIPDYLQKTYYWAYLNPRNVKLLDREWIVRTILWQQHHRLSQAAISEIEPGQNVLQRACVYGNF